MKNSLTLIITVLFTTPFFSCSTSDPSTSAKEILKNQVTTVSNGYFKLINMIKKDAVNKTVFGVKTYSIKYTAEVECVKDGGWIYVSRSDGKLWPRGVQVLDRYSEGNTNKQTKIGDKYQFDGSMTLEKHEQGWVLSGR